MKNRRMCDALSCDFMKDVAKTLSFSLSIISYAGEHGDNSESIIFLKVISALAIPLWRGQFNPRVVMLNLFQHLLS
ncbi:hypothetical protein [Pedobacter aquatilis]|uniref:hypothetical protein n=1 Tax=Pedobacter aquatilis TaxID=351343 RepID=UPI00292E2256|nr:hypothetical protein [Pedobacter aquatilis]